MPISQESHNRAKAVIVEIIRRSGGNLSNKTHLFKAFWKAHVTAAQTEAMPLTEYPIVRMPRGPGIHEVSKLLGELMAEGVISVDPPSDDAFSPFEFSIINNAAYSGVLTTSEQSAVAAGVASVAGKTTSQVSEESHRDSRSWNAVRNGEELDIDLDAIPDDVFSQRKNAITKKSQLVDEIFN